MISPHPFSILRGLTLAAAILLPVAPISARDEEPRELLIHAASSLREVCETVGEIYSELEPETRLVFSFGGSNDLARQIVAGGRADLFLSADERRMERVEEAGLVEPGTREIFCSNSLVIIEPADPALRGELELLEPADLLELEHFSLADPDGVPAGVYARQWLESRELWEELRGSVVAGIDVRGALAAVESGACRAGIVYRTDARVTEDVRVAFPVPEEENPPIRYVAAVIAGCTEREAARGFLRTLRGATGRVVLERYGFLPAAPSEDAAYTSSGAPPSVWSALWISLKVAACATLIVLLPGAAIGWLLARRRWRGKSFVETLVALPLVLPPTAVGFVLLSLLARNGPLGELFLGFDLGLLLTWKGAVIAASVMSLPLVARTARIAFEAVDPRLEAMGASLGLGRRAVMMRITLPLARRGLIAAGILGFSRALGEFGATVIVAGNIPGKTQTLALAIFQDIQIGRDQRAMGLLLISVVLAFASIWLVEFLVHRDVAGKEAR
jgi:molybdate transport system permease protein